MMLETRPSLSKLGMGVMRYGPFANFGNLSLRPLTRSQGLEMRNFLKQGHFLNEHPNDARNKAKIAELGMWVMRYGLFASFGDLSLRPLTCSQGLEMRTFLKQRHFLNKHPKNAQNKAKIVKIGDVVHEICPIFFFWQPEPETFNSLPGPGNEKFFETRPFFK